MADLSLELKNIGVEYDIALKRFLDKPDFYKEFLIKFLEDSQMSRLETALKAKDVHESFKAAHTLKGLSANLGFANLLQYIAPLVEILRAESLEGTQILFDSLTQEYDLLCDILTQYRA